MAIKSYIANKKSMIKSYLSEDEGSVNEKPSNHNELMMPQGGIMSIH